MIYLRYAETVIVRIQLIYYLGSFNNAIKARQINFFLISNQIFSPSKKATVLRYKARQLVIERECDQVTVIARFTIVNYLAFFYIFFYRNKFTRLSERSRVGYTKRIYRQGEVCYVSQWEKLRSMKWTGIRNLSLFHMRSVHVSLVVPLLGKSIHRILSLPRERRVFILPWFICGTFLRRGTFWYPANLEDIPHYETIG